MHNVTFPVKPTDPDKRERHVKLAHQLAVELVDAGMSGSDGILVLSIALGIYLEAQEHSHRNLRPLSDVMFEVAQDAFDKLRTARARDPGHA